MKKHLYTFKIGLEGCNIQRLSCRRGVSSQIESLADHNFQDVDPAVDCRANQAREIIFARRRGSEAAIDKGEYIHVHYDTFGKLTRDGAVLLV